MPQFLQVSSLILHNHSGTAKQLGKQQFWKSCSSDQKNLTGTLQPVLIKWQLDSQGHTRGETALSHPSLQSSTHPSGAVFGFRGRRELRHAKRLPQGKKIHPVFCSVLVAACHGSRAGGSHLLHLDSLGTGLEEGKMSIIAATARNQSNLVLCSPDRPEPFSQKAKAGGKWKLQFWF